ncbi:MAG: c-type cytochrome [Nitrospinota bacterium]
MKKVVSPVFGAWTFLFLFPAFLESADVVDGQEVFKKKCAPCHYITKKRKVGPGLAGIRRRITREWAREWIADPQGTWERNDGYTQVLRKSVRDGERRTKTLMQFKVVKGPPGSEEIEAVLEYMDTL